MGIVGLPNVGKSTLFNVLTKVRSKTAGGGGSGDEPGRRADPVSSAAAARQLSLSCPSLSHPNRLSLTNKRRPTTTKQNKTKQQQQQQQQIGVPAENFPFCTIEPNQARVNVPDDRFTWLCGVYKPKSQVPAFLDICDIAGLVRWVYFCMKERKSWPPAPRGRGRGSASSTTAAHATTPHPKKLIPPKQAPPQTTLKQPQNHQQRRRQGRGSGQRLPQPHQRGRRHLPRVPRF